MMFLLYETLILYDLYEILAEISEIYINVNLT